MGNFKGKYIKTVVLISLVCFASVNIFPYDVIGIMIEKSKEDEGLKDAYLLIRKGYEESLDSLGRYEVVKESDEEEFYLLKRGGLTKEGIDSMYMELNGKDYNNIFMLDTPDYSGEFNIQKKQIDSKDIIIAGISLCLIFGTALTFNGYFTKIGVNDSKLQILSIPSLTLAIYNFLFEISQLMIKRKHADIPLNNYAEFINGLNCKKKEMNNNQILKRILWSTPITMIRSSFGSLFIDQNKTSRESKVVFYVSSLLFFISDYIILEKLLQKPYKSKSKYFNYGYKYFN